MKNPTTFTGTAPNYPHGRQLICSNIFRIGRVGRAERMGLAISLVSSVPEKVWFHGEWCSSRGKGCSNNRLTSEGGCCIWYDENQVND